MLGWTLLSALLIGGGCTGLLLSLWRCRMWFFYAVLCITVHNAFDFIVCRYFPIKTRMLMLKPEATFEGYAAGVLGCFLLFTVVSAPIFRVVTHSANFRQSSTWLKSSGSCRYPLSCLWSHLTTQLAPLPRVLFTKKRFKESTFRFCSASSPFCLWLANSKSTSS